MHSTATYSKTRFHELVKLYHPDRIASFDNDVPQAVRIERYRLIIAAHTILSDPTRRSAYDRFGAGWEGRAEAPVRDPWYHGSDYPPPGPFSRSWSDPNDRIWRNATWEDWEKYYEWRAKKDGTAEGVNRKTQSPIYFNNTYFFLMVMILALMGSTANYNRAQDAGTYFVQQRDIVHDRAARELRRVRQEATTSGTKQDRVEWFLRNLEATRGLNNTDAEALREEKVGRLLPHRDVCRSEKTSQTND
jgi:curved DNA-binding protein CbpA